MNEVKFTVEIYATKETVWDTLWQDATFREWAGLIDPGTYMVGELIEGGEVQFISAENGYGVTSLVEKVIPNEYLRLLHQADTQDTGTREREKEWTGGAETYTLKETNGTTTLTAVFDVPQELKDYFQTAYPKALDRVIELAETN
jgi:uncharacterized protein YndB with AHSA1/START domain